MKLPSMSNYRVHIIETLAEFCKIGEQWNRLVQSTPLDHAFMRHEWFSCWIEAYSAGERLAVVTLWQEEQLVAAAPLQRVNETRKYVPIRTLKFLQSPVSPRCNIICTTAEEMELILKAVYALPNWDMLVLENLEEDRPSTRHLLKTIHAGNDIRGWVTNGRQSPFMSISGTWDGYLASLDSAHRRVIKIEGTKRFDKVKSHSVYQLNPAQDADNAFALMRDVSGRSWKEAEGSAIGQLTAMQSFYEQYVPVALKLGDMQVWVIEIDGVIAGFECGLTNNNRFSLIRTDYDMNYKYYHPGENIRIAIIKQLFDSGKPGEYDMGGDAAQYKMKWATGIRRHVNVVIANNSWRAQAIAFGRYRVKPLIDRLLRNPQSKLRQTQQPELAEDYTE
jgi:CelD/BcsL family acetyltransferase involved in cellulose biosynthesis